MRFRYYDTYWGTKNLLSFFFFPYNITAHKGIFKYSSIVHKYRGRKIMRKTIVCLLSFLSVLILCSVSYQPAIIAQATNTNSHDNISKSLLNIDNADKDSLSLLTWLRYIIKRIIEIIWSGILLLLRPILAPIFWILFVILKLLFPS